MSQFPDTSETLVHRVKELGDQIAWEEFSNIYRPVIYRVARSHGMQEADAQDLTQQVLLAVSTAIGRWEKRDPEVRFRHWLSRITRNAILKFFSRGNGDLAVGGTAMMNLLEECPDPNPETVRVIDIEYRRQLYLQAVQHVQSKVQADSWRIFEMTVLGSVPIEQAARQTNRSVGSIYAIRSRVMRRLRESVSRMEDAER